MNNKIRLSLCLMLILLATLTGCSLLTKKGDALVKLNIFNIQRYAPTQITVTLNQANQRPQTITQPCTTDDVATFEFKNIQSGSWNVTFQIQRTDQKDLNVTIHDGILIEAGKTNVHSFIADGERITEDSLDNYDVKVNTLDYNIIDAEYNTALEQIIFASSNPNQLHIYCPSMPEETTIDLPLVPTSVSVGPDGIHAAVGYDGYVSYVSLSEGKILKTYPLSTTQPDVVLADNGYIYALPGPQTVESIHSLNLANGVETDGGDIGIAQGTKAKLHPQGQAIYGANNFVSPDDIVKYDITAGTAKYLYDSRYHGDYPIGGDLWISKDGLRIFTRLGAIFSTSDDPEQDITYLGSLSHLNIIGSVDHSVSANKIAALLNSGSAFNTYNYTDLTYQETLSLPMVTYKNITYHASGKYIFFDSTGEKIFVVAQLYNSNVFAVVSY